ncbi:hypothetical protein BP6252_07299 [Coleophoma cylindrospora]|uniref:Heterokaryon incompatibility domain-containing protein n=1 Tax=Coleophoma cylindrospora TaxID=1849047 RepID=A0A3D8RH61_9HELO|nr:hypothetical protein BP6252_07299 [Coleophoma cylindrospora]
MGQIYEQAVLSLAAAASARASDGLFRRRNVTAMEDTFVLNSLENSSSAVIKICKKNPQVPEDECPLYTRGWVTQEQFNANRIVHFTSIEVFWQCESLTYASETYPDGLRDGLELYDEAILDWVPQRKQTSQAYSLHNLWTGVIFDYSNRALTNQVDRLIAVSGIASVLQSRYGDIYLAGLWASYLSFQLSWFRGAVATQFYTAPSWSWASTIGRVQFTYGSGQGLTPETTTLIELVEYDIKTPPGGDLLGQVTYGLLRLSCFLMTVSFRGKMRTESSKISLNGEWIKERSNDLYLSFDPWAQEAYPGGFDSEHVHFMPLVCELATQRKTDIRYVKGILMVPNSSHQGQFRRVGFMHIESQSQRKEEPPVSFPFNIDFGNWGIVKNEAWLQFERVHPDGKYIISII